MNRSVIYSPHVLPPTVLGMQPPPFSVEHATSDAPRWLIEVDVQKWFVPAIIHIHVENFGILIIRQKTTLMTDPQTVQPWPPVPSPLLQPPPPVHCSDDNVASNSPKSHPNGARLPGTCRRQIEGHYLNKTTSAHRNQQICWLLPESLRRLWDLAAGWTTG